MELVFVFYVVRFRNFWFHLTYSKEKDNHYLSPCFLLIYNASKRPSALLDIVTRNMFTAGDHCIRELVNANKKLLSAADKNQWPPFQFKNSSQRFFYCLFFGAYWHFFRSSVQTKPLSSFLGLRIPKHDITLVVIIRDPSSILQFWAFLFLFGL